MPHSCIMLRDYFKARLYCRDAAFCLWHPFSTRTAIRRCGKIQFQLPPSSAQSTDVQASEATAFAPELRRVAQKMELILSQAQTKETNVVQWTSGNSWESPFNLELGVCSQWKKRRTKHQSKRTKNTKIEILWNGREFPRSPCTSWMGDLASEYYSCVREGLSPWRRIRNLADLWHRFKGL